MFKQTVPPKEVDKCKIFIKDFLREVESKVPRVGSNYPIPSLPREVSAKMFCLPGTYAFGFCKAASMAIFVICSSHST